MKVSHYSKFIVAAIAAGGLALSAVLTDDTVTYDEALTVALAVLAALGVYALPNTPPGP